MTLVLLLVLALFLPYPEDQSAWELRKHKDGIEIYTRPVESSDLDEFKGIITIQNSSVQDVLRVILQIEEYEEWFPDCLEARLLAQEDDLNQVHYFSIKAPWPVKNREAVYRSQTTFTNGDSRVRVELVNLEGYVKETKNFVRMYKGQGFWELSKQEDDSVRVLYQFQSDPGGKIPAWLANMSVVSNPFQTLTSLRDRLLKLRE